MWAQLFWSMQFVWALSYVYVHYRREPGLVFFGIATKIIVGTLLLRAYAMGVVYWPIGLVGACCEWVLAALFVVELRRS